MGSSTVSRPENLCPDQKIHYLEKFFDAGLKFAACELLASTLFCISSVTGTHSIFVSKRVNLLRVHKLVVSRLLNPSVANGSSTQNCLRGYAQLMQHLLP